MIFIVGSFMETCVANVRENCLSNVLMQLGKGKVRSRLVYEWKVLLSSHVVSAIRVFRLDRIGSKKT